jgi:hypothetical protein
LQKGFLNDRHDIDLNVFFWIKIALREFEMKGNLSGREASKK